MFIRNASESDVSQILKIYESAKLALKENGVDQWQDGNPSLDSLNKDLDRGYSRVCECKAKVLGTAALYIGTEPTYNKISDGKWLTSEKKYGIVHRIAIDPEQKGGGLCGKFFDYLKEKCIRKEIKSIRCDTHRDNIAMQRAMLKYGFVYCGVIIIDDGSERLAYEYVI